MAKFVEKITYFSVLVLLIICGKYLSGQYRDLIYTTKIEDFGLADAGANLIIVCLNCHFIWLFKKNGRLFENRFLDVLFITTFYVVIECASYFVSGLGTFDFKDIVAMIVGGILTTLLVHIYNFAFKA